MKTYTPLSSAGPAFIAGAVLLAGYVVGPAVGYLLHRRNAIRVNALFLLGNAEALNTLADVGD